MKISTKTGDKAQTSLMFGRRVSKACQRVKAYGAVDSLSAQIAMARAFAGKSALGGELLNIQKKLVLLMTELATDNADYPKLSQKNVPLLQQPDLEELEKKIEEMESAGDTFTGWKHAGDTPLDAALNLARTACREAERQIAELSQMQPLPRELIPAYINRLSDLLYLYSISADKTAGYQE